MQRQNTLVPPCGMVFNAAWGGRGSEAHSSADRRHATARTHTSGGPSAVDRRPREFKGRDAALRVSQGQGRAWDTALCGGKQLQVRVFDVLAAAAGVAALAFLGRGVLPRGLLGTPPSFLLFLQRQTKTHEICGRHVSLMQAHFSNETDPACRAV